MRLAWKGLWTQDVMDWSSNEAKYTETWRESMSGGHTRMSSQSGWLSARRDYQDGWRPGFKEERTQIDKHKPINMNQTKLKLAPFTRSI